jgi:glycogen operon protein
MIQVLRKRREVVMATLDTRDDTFSIRIHNDAPETVVELHGKLDSALSPEHRAQVLAVVRPGCRLVLDLSRLTGISSVGLRMLLLYCRHVQASGGTVSGTGIAQEWLDLAEAAGFGQLFRQTATALQRPRIPAAQTVAVDAYPTHVHAGFALRPGFPIPFGATLVTRGLNFSVYSRHASACTLVLFEPDRTAPFVEIPFPAEFRIGDVFAMIVFDLNYENLEYGFRMDGPLDPPHGHRFDRSRILLDPMARAVSGRDVWGAPVTKPNPYPLRACIVPQDFDWEGDRPLGLPIEELVIYEMHVRDFTASPSARVKHPGTFAGLREKIPYLKELGVNCVELLPIFEFDELENDRTNPRTGERLWNHWGYSTIGFFAPKAGFAATGRVGMQADECKALVKELHANGIEVMLDVVFNHTAEGNEHGPTISFRGLDNRTYYMLTPEGYYYNFSGCGNTLNCNHPVVRGFVIECLRYWVAEYHIDGFRFDLASILGRDQNGVPLANPPLLEALAGDPVLGKTKLIAEAWDAGGLYQVGSFPDYGRWAEWNGKYRDCVRRFLKGDVGLVGEMATRLSGSADLYEGRGATASINFVTCHDGFTLADLVSYNEKHNEANGEDNRDGANDNHSWNCGVEGATDDPAVNALRRRQIKNALALLFLSQGVPMLLMGDECGRTQQGNNNAYCHDSPLVWFDWSQLETNAELFRFCQALIRFRQRHPMLGCPFHAGTPGPGEHEGQVSWHGTRPWNPDWSAGSRVLAFQRTGRDRAGRAVGIYAALNMYWEPLDFELPPPPFGQHWHLFADTLRSAPEDVYAPGQEPPLDDSGTMRIGSRSIVVLVTR